MDKPKIIQSNDYNFNIWYETYDPVFSDISIKSRLPEKWVGYQFIKSYKNTILSPINRYVEELYPHPKLISIKDNTVTLRQHNHADFFLLVEKNNELYNVDRPWMRQYYNTSYNDKTPDYCFPGIYKFYEPWHLDFDGSIFYKNCESESPFFIYESKIQNNKINKNNRYLEPNFIPFSFKKIGKHMQDENFGKILRDSAMFDIVFEADDIIINRIKEFYEKN